ncbi:class I ribonucleotide reductase maintenance protein YfaE [Marinicellulosiphila megalodicopiae]|uniref:class I ribonucleotide reductase maintenance protein YfaE n=1 Tax=Marinicellulosiphila megalodicopiae TaxID=2724896 RepID=UPI003BB1B9D5
MSKKSSKLIDPNQLDFFLVGLADDTPAFELTGNPDTPISYDAIEEQNEFLFFLEDAEAPREEVQLDLTSFEKPIHYIEVDGIDSKIKFQKANNLLESLEAKGIHVSYQCREGYCGSCRTDLVEGEVAYLTHPLAWINEGEILPCCCVPRTNIKLKVN